MNPVHPPVSLTAFAAAVLLASSMMFLIGGYVGVLRQRTGSNVPEGSWKVWTDPYSPASVHQYLLSAGEGGWHVYRVALWWDIVFSSVFAVSGFVLVNGLWGVTDVSGPWLMLFRAAPVAAGAVDIMEDVLLLDGIGVTPVPVTGDLPDPARVSLAVWFTRAKVALYLLAILWVLSGAVALVVGGRA